MSADDMDLDEFTRRLKELKKTGDAMLLRASELEARPAAVAAARSYLEVVMKAVNTWTETKPWITEGDRKELSDKVGEATALMCYCAAVLLCQCARGMCRVWSWGMLESGGLCRVV